MGLLDVLNGMQNGPRGQTDPNAKGELCGILGDEVDQAAW